jgi:hypothetical protein
VNAVEHNDSEHPTVGVTVERRPSEACVRIDDDGPGMTAEQRRILEGDHLPQYDDPSVGFGLAITSLLLEQFGGSTSVETAPQGGTRITVDLAREIADDPVSGKRNAYGVGSRRLVAVTAATLVAGVAMGVVQQTVTGSIAVIGSLYGVGNVGVGWITHLFHSVVFGVVFAAVLALPRVRRSVQRSAHTVGLGVAYGVFLWLFAAGVVMPLWLQSAGIPATVPRLNLPGLLTHALWGVVLGGVYATLK